MEEQIIKNILVTGSNGQLGATFRRVVNDETGGCDCNCCHFFFTDILELDITNMDRIYLYVDMYRITHIINCAAYTAVDRAEDDIAQAYLINSEAVRNLVRVCEEKGIILYHISTDYVFNGESATPYKITDVISPVSVYGKSKAAGEQAIVNSNISATIIRTSWLYSEYGTNFMKTIIKSGREREEIMVVNDQWGCPTYCEDLAFFILFLIRKEDMRQEVEIFHFSNKGALTWYDFAKSILEEAGIYCKVVPVPSAGYPSKAIRPKYSVFDLSETEKRHSYFIPDYMSSLRRAVLQFKEEEKKQAANIV